MAGIRHPEFIKELESTKYPFVPTASLTNGQANLLEGTFLDAHLYAVGGERRYYLSKVVVSSSKLEIYVGDFDGAIQMVGQVNLPIASDVVELFDDYNRPAGVLVSEAIRLSLLAGWGVGEHTFKREDTEFCITCQMPVPDVGVSGLEYEEGKIISGKVWFVGEDGVVIRTEQTTNSAGDLLNVLRFDIVGDPLFLQKLCIPEDLFTPATPIKTIRIVQGDYTYDCQADDTGNFNLQMNDSLAADAALRIRTTDAGILFQVEGTTNL
jgi:hypothetical protein